MSKHPQLAVLLALTLLCSCAQNARRGAAAGGERHIPELLSAVPSDALAVVCSDRCSDAMPLLDSLNVLHRLDLSAFGQAPAALSLCYNGSIVPVLALDAGRTEASDSASAVSTLLAQAATLRLHAEYIRPDAAAKRRGMVIITPSEAQLTAVRRHIGEYTSILDAPGFRQALAAAASDEFILFRNSGAARLAPKSWLQGIFPRRELTDFLAAAAEWTALVPEGDGWDVIPSCTAADEAHFASLFATLPPADSRLGALLPPGTRFALALPVVDPALRETFERYQDASVRLTRYQKRLEELRRQSGKDPLKWEKELGVKEVALVHFAQDCAVTLVRPGRAVSASEPAPNPWRGFLPALYGSAFTLADDSFTAAYGGWYLYGSEQSVRAFIETERPEETDAAPKWPGKGCRAIIQEPDKTLTWGKKGIHLTWNSNQ